VHNASEYDRGVVAGGVAERLDSHDVHLSKINGNIRDMAGEVHDLKVSTVESLANMTMQLQRLVDAAEASRREVLATAKALEQADQARRKATELVRDASDAKLAVSARYWQPWQRGLALLAGFATIVGLIVLAATKIAGS